MSAVNCSLSRINISPRRNRISARFGAGVLRHLSNAPCAAFTAALTSSTQRRDRKSTRLNSSHSQISYAVFCLKKKKKKTKKKKKKKKISSKKIQKECDNSQSPL